MVILDSDSDQPPELGADTHPFQAKAGERQLALERYRCLKRVSESDLTLDDKLFIENFEAAVRFWWKVKLSASDEGVK